MDREWTWLLLVLVVVVALAILAPLGTRYYRWRIERWCRENRFELIDWRGLRFYERPISGWYYSAEQDAFRIVVKDRDGLTREGHLVFGDFWGFRPWKVRVEWD